MQPETLGRNALWKFNGVTATTRTPEWQPTETRWKRGAAGSIGSHRTRGSGSDGIGRQKRTSTSAEAPRNRQYRLLLDVSASLQQQLHHILVSGLGGQMQRRFLHAERTHHQ